MASFIIFAIVSFFAGILTFLAPCTLPLLPAYFAQASQSGKQITKNTIYFSVGIALMLTALGIGAGALGTLLLGIRAELALVLALAIIVFGTMSVFGLKLGLFSSERISKKYGSLLFGSMFGLLWTGCIGPVLGLILLLAAKSSTILGGGVLLFLYGLGLTFPLILLSLFIERIPRDGKFWRVVKGKIFTLHLGTKTLYIHSTNIVTGSMFIILGIFLLLEQFYGVTGFLPQGIVEWGFSLQEKLVSLLGLQ